MRIINFRRSSRREGKKEGELFESYAKILGLSYIGLFTISIIISLKFV